MANGTQTQTFMSTPPKVITSKDLLYLRDAMGWKLLQAKKCSHYADMCQDPEIKNLLHEIGRMHQSHYMKLLNHLDPNSTV